MKKFFVTISLILGLTTGIFATSYKNIVITDDAASIIKSFRLDNFTKTYINHKGIKFKTYVLHYDDVSSEFIYLNNSNVVEISSSKIKDFIRKGNYIQVNSTIFNADGICRSFTKSLAPDYPNHLTRKNYTYQKIIPNQKVKYGTVMYLMLIEIIKDTQLFFCM